MIAMYMTTTVVLTTDMPFQKDGAGGGEKLDQNATINKVNLIGLGRMAFEFSNSCFFFFHTVVIPARFFCINRTCLL